MQPVYVGGIGMTKFGKDPRPIVEIFCQAGQEALAASQAEQVEAIYIGSMNPEEFTGESNIASQIAEALGLTGIPALRIETASSAGAAALQAGFQPLLRDTIAGSWSWAERRSPISVPAPPRASWQRS